MCLRKLAKRTFHTTYRYADSPEGRVWGITVGAPRVCGENFRSEHTGRRPNSLASLAAASPYARFSLRSKKTPNDLPRMPSRRTIKKPTRWTPEEWRHIEEAARARGVPPLRYVREAALAARLPPRVRRRGSHELVKQLMRLLNNLHQLERVAEAEAAHRAV